VQAADLAGHGLFEFQSMLRDRRIPQHYDWQKLRIRFNRAATRGRGRPKCGNAGGAPLRHHPVRY
jgi:hypothetical protein